MSTRIKLAAALAVVGLLIVTFADAEAAVLVATGLVLGAIVLAVVDYRAWQGSVAESEERG